MTGVPERLTFPRNVTRRDDVGDAARVRLWQRVLTTAAVLAVAGGLMGTAAFGAFSNAHDPFPHSVPAPQAP